MFAGSYFGQSYFAQGASTGLIVDTPVWVSPANHATGINQITQLVFVIPIAQDNIHFELQYDTANTFNSGNLVDVKSWQSQTGWEYYNGSSWVSIPQSGIDPTYAGSQARFTLQSPLAATIWYRRIRGRVKVG